MSAEFPVVPAPWKCKFDNYWLPFYSRGPLPDNVYSPLEASSPAFSDPARAGEFKGGWGMYQVKFDTLAGETPWAIH